MNDILKKLRLDSGLTITEVAQYLKLDRSSLSRIERGIRELHLHDLSALADLYNVSTDYILGRSKDKNLKIVEIQPTLISSSPLHITKEYKDLINILDLLTSEELIMAKGALIVLFGKEHLNTKSRA